MRNIIHLIDNLIDYIPKELGRFINKLESIREASLYLAPEASSISFNRVALVLQNDLQEFEGKNIPWVEELLKEWQDKENLGRLNWKGLADSLPEFCEKVYNKEIIL